MLVGEQKCPWARVDVYPRLGMQAKSAGLEVLVDGLIPPTAAA